MNRSNEASGGLPPGLATTRALGSPSTCTFCARRRIAHGVMKLEVNLKASDGSFTFWQPKGCQMAESAQFALNFHWEDAVVLHCIGPVAESS